MKALVSAFGVFGLAFSAVQETYLDAAMRKEKNFGEDEGSYFSRMMQKLDDETPVKKDRVVDQKVELMDDYYYVIDIEIGYEAQLFKLIPDTGRGEVSLIHDDCMYCLARDEGYWMPNS